MGFAIRSDEARTTEQVLKTSAKDAIGRALDYHLHFWLGRDATHDEKGTVTYKAGELDDSLGGTPVQHRECEGHESELFMSYFKKGVEYLPGGGDANRGRPDELFRTRMLHLKGSHRVRARQVEPGARAMNSGDVFILDCGEVGAAGQRRADCARPHGGGSGRAGGLPVERQGGLAEGEGGGYERGRADQARARREGAGRALRGGRRALRVLVRGVVHE
jgi:hypothetical protein